MNIIVNFCIPLWNVGDNIKQMQDKQIPWDFNNDKPCSILWEVLQELKMTLINEFEKNR